MNPYNTVPVLVERDLVLHESNIINEYIDERFTSTTDARRSGDRGPCASFPRFHRGNLLPHRRARKTRKTPDKGTQLDPRPLMQSRWCSTSRNMLGDDYSMLDVALRAAAVAFVTMKSSCRRRRLRCSSMPSDCSAARVIDALTPPSAACARRRQLHSRRDERTIPPNPIWSVRYEWCVDQATAYLAGTREQQNAGAGGVRQNSEIVLNVGPPGGHQLKDGQRLGAVQRAFQCASRRGRGAILGGYRHFAKETGYGMGFSPRSTPPGWG